MRDTENYLDSAAGLSQRSSTLNLRVRKRFDSQSAFELEVSASVNPGIAIVFGPSGAGKTTLLECIAGLLTPNSGRISIADRLLFDSERKVDVDVRCRKIGYVFQDLALFPHLTVKKNIEYGIRNLPKSVREQKVEAIADSFRIGALANRKPAKISGGERQRVALARAIVTDPCVLLLDEPLAALDQRTKNKIIDDLRAWNSVNRIPVLYVTHSREEVFALGERVLLLEAGRIIAEGTPNDVMPRS
jgi:molybdate transport system ATP-binding protein